MHENAPVLSANKRERVGSRYARRLREAGRLPAVVYGHGQAPVAIEVDARDALSHIHKGEKVFQFALDGANQPDLLLLKELQYDYLGSGIVHADFTRVNLDERVTTRVHIRMIGDAEGLKHAGTVMMHPATEIEIECTLRNMPDEIEADVSHLGVGDSLTAGEVKLPLETMKLISDPEMVLAHITHGKTMAAGEEEVTVEGGAEPEVITERKDKEEEESD
ncbi:MAG: 50S ribosomal protein L25 [Phycisphaerales bacterium JB039]